MSPSSRLLHATVVTDDLGRSLEFYDAALGALAMSRHSEFGDEEAAGSAEAVGYSATGADAVFWVVTGSPITTGAHLAFLASDSEQVRAFYTAATSAGGVGVLGPRRWEIYRPGYFGALVTGPGGNLIEAVATE